jgi:tetratricopeptide (TPR) repeat protein
MTRLLLSILVLCTGSAMAQPSQPSPLEEEAKTNKRLLPKYGLLAKSEREIAADKDFVTDIMSQTQFNGDYRAASNHLIKLGFSYLYRGDPKTAMYRFNQAFLLDSTNTDIYWGYGAFYMSLGNFEKGKKQFLEGLAKDPNNTHLLTDYATYFLGQYYGLNDAGLEKQAMTSLDSAITFLEKSHSLDKSDPSTATKQSVCYWIKGDCEKAWYFHDKAKELGATQLTEAYTADLKKKCKRGK